MLLLPLLEYTMTRIYAISQSNLTAIDAPYNSSTKDEHILVSTRNGEIPSYTSEVQISTRNENTLANTRNLGYSSNTNTVDQANSQIDLEVEKFQHEKKANLRTETFKAILCGSSIKFSWPKFIFDITGTIIFSFALTTPFTLLPAENVFHHPDRWYEILLPGVAYSIMHSIWAVFNTASYMNTSYIKTVRHIFVVCLVATVVLIALIVFAYYVWSYVLQYTYPVPFIGFMVDDILFLTIHLIIWFRFPLKLRKDIIFRRRMKYFIAAKLYALGIIIQYTILAKLLLMIQNKYQPIVAMFLPVMKEVNSRIFNNLIGNSSNGDDHGSKLTGTYAIASIHAVMLCVLMGSVTTEVTSWCLMGVDFLDNIYSCLLYTSDAADE